MFRLANLKRFDRLSLSAPYSISHVYELNLLALCIIPLLSLLLYTNSLHGAFVFDDLALIPENPNITSIHSFSDTFHSGSGWRGLTSWTYALNFYFGGLDPFSYHLLNLLLHISNSLLVFFILLHLTNHSIRSLYGGLFFASHPFLTSSVSLVYSRSSLLCAFFYFFAILSWLRSEYEFGVKHGKWYAAISFLLGLWSKQDAIALPFFLLTTVLLYTDWSRVDSKLRRTLSIALGIPLFLAITFRSEILSLYRLASTPPQISYAGLDLALPQPAFFLTYLSGIVGYIFPRWLLPLNLSTDPYIPLPTTFFIALSLTIITTLFFIMIRSRESHPLLSYGLAAILISPIPFYSLFPLPDPIIDHRFYIPFLGFVIIFIWAMDYLPQRHSLYILLLSIFSFMTISRNHVFHSSFTYWSDATLHSPLKARPHLNLGYYYDVSLHDYPNALASYQKAISLNPRLYAAYQNIAAIQKNLGNISAAEQTFTELTSLSPTFPEPYINLGLINRDRGDLQRALAFFDKAVELNPNSLAAINERDKTLKLFISSQK